MEDNTSYQKFRCPVCNESPTKGQLDWETKRRFSAIVTVDSAIHCQDFGCIYVCPCCGSATSLQSYIDSGNKIITPTNHFESELFIV